MPYQSTEYNGACLSGYILMWFMASALSLSLCIEIIFTKTRSEYISAVGIEEYILIV